MHPIINITAYTKHHTTFHGLSSSVMVSQKIKKATNLSVSPDIYHTTRKSRNMTEKADRLLLRVMEYMPGKRHYDMQDTDVVKGILATLASTLFCPLLCHIVLVMI